MFLPTVLLLLLSAVAHCNPAVVFVDSENSYIADQTTKVHLSPEGLTASLHALLSVPPTFDVSPIASRQAELVAAPDVFRRPQAVIAVQLAGLNLGSDLDSFVSSLGKATGFRLNDVAAKLLQAVSTVKFADGVKHLPLDHRGIPNCGDSCIEEGLQHLLAVMGANYSRPEDQQPLDGHLLLLPVSPRVSLIELDLTDLNCRLWVVELVNIVQGADLAGGYAADSVPVLSETALVGLQALADKFGRDSAEFNSAKQASFAVLRLIYDKLYQAFGGRVVLQLGVLGPIPAGTLRELLSWRDSGSRRRLLHRQLEGELEPTGESAVAWMTSAVAVLVFIIILVSAIGATYSVAYMKYKQDTLLYSRPKAE